MTNCEKMIKLFNDMGSKKLSYGVNPGIAANQLGMTAKEAEGELVFLAAKDILTYENGYYTINKDYKQTFWMPTDLTELDFMIALDEFDPEDE